MTAPRTGRRAPRPATRRRGAAAAPTVVDDVRAVGVLELVDPAQLIIGPNVRLHPVEDALFLASIRERGVLQPITCYRDDVGALVVWIGQRRTLAAVTVGAATVPVWIVEQPPDSDRVVDQLIENDKRSPLSTGDRIAGVAQLAVFGLSAGAIATRASYRRADVDAALVVAGSDAARAAAAAVPEVTLDQAAAIAEFDTDPAIVEALTAAAAAGRFDHALQVARDARRDQEDRDAAAAELRARGVRVLDERPAWDGPARQLSALGIPVTWTAHGLCPGHAAWLDHVVERIDGGQEQPVWRPVWFCTDAARYGHTLPAAPAPQTALPLRDERQAAEDERRAEDARFARQWRTVAEVRRTWLRSFAVWRTCPAPGVERFVVEALLSGGLPLAEAMSHRHRHRLLEVLSYPLGPGDVDVELAAAHPRRALVLGAALVLAAWHDSSTVSTWRAPRPIDRLYLQQIVQWGYPPCDVEQLLIDDETEGGSRG